MPFLHVVDDVPYADELLVQGGIDLHGEDALHVERVYRLQEGSIVQLKGAGEGRAVQEDVRWSIAWVLPAPGTPASKVSCARHRHDCQLYTIELAA